MSRIHQIDARFGFSKNLAESLSLSVDAAQKALTIDDTMSDGYMMLAGVNLIKRQYDQMIDNCEKALSLVPTDFAMTHCGRMWTYVGRSEKALELITRAMRRNPYFDSQYLFPLGNAHRLLGNYDEAIATMKIWRDSEPNLISPLIMLTVTYAEAGSMEKSRAMMKKLLRQFPKFTTKTPRRVLRYKDPADIERIINNLLKAGAPE